MLSRSTASLHLGFWKERNEGEQTEPTPWRWLGKKSGLGDTDESPRWNLWANIVKS